MRKKSSISPSLQTFTVIPAGLEEVVMAMSADSISFESALFIHQSNYQADCKRYRQYHFLSKRRWLPAPFMSMRCSTPKHRQSRMKSLLSFEASPFWFTGKLTTLALSMIPSLSILIWLIWLPKGFSPKSISQQMTPMDQTSTFVEIIAFWSETKHSGGRYQQVPTPCEVSSSTSSLVVLHSPKSVIFTLPLWKRMFWGFRSQWMTLSLSSCRYLIALMTCRMMSLASFSGIFLCFFRQKERSGPSQYSRTVQKELASISTVSQSCTMLGCESILCTLFSLTACFTQFSRAELFQLEWNSWILTATSRSSSMSQPLQTSLNPPFPRRPSSWYFLILGQLPIPLASSRPYLECSSSQSRRHSLIWSAFSSSSRLIAS